MSNEVSPVLKAMADRHSLTFSESQLRRVNHCYADEMPSRRDLELTTSQRECLLIETAYRRGYVQGFWFGLDTRNQTTSKKAEAWFHEVLFPWRQIRHGGLLQLPPEFPDKLRHNDQEVIEFFTKYGVGK